MAYNVEIGNISYKTIIYFCLGLTSTMSILSIPLAGKLITAFNLFLVFTFIALITEKSCKAHISNLGIKYLVWMSIGLASSLFGYLFFIGVEEFQLTSVSYVPKIVIYSALYYLIAKSVNRAIIAKFICKGVLWGCVFNICWAIVDAIGYYLTGVSITNDLFSYYIAASDVRYGQISLLFAGTIRAGGINYDPANIGMFAPIVALYGLKTRSYFIYVLSILSILASLSHTAFIGILVVTLYYLYTSKRKIISLTIFSLVVLSAILIVQALDLEVMGTMTDAFVDRTEQKAEGAGDNAREEYWTNFIPAAASQPSALVIGTGYFTASYPYLKNGYVHNDFEPYDPEQTFFSMYFDIGIIGLIVFLGMLYGIYKRIKHLSYTGSRDYAFVLSGVVGFTISFMGYHYTMYSVVMLVIIASIIICEEGMINLKMNNKV